RSSDPSLNELSTARRSHWITASHERGRTAKNEVLRIIAGGGERAVCPGGTPTGSWRRGNGELTRPRRTAPEQSHEQSCSHHRERPQPHDSHLFVIAGSALTASGTG